MSNGPVTPSWIEDGLPRLDVRGMEPPYPLITIVGYLEKDDTGDQVIVDLDRDPVHLYPELAERGWNAEHVQAPDGNVRLRIFRRIVQRSTGSA